MSTIQRGLKSRSMLSLDSLKKNDASSSELGEKPLQDTNKIATSFYQDLGMSEGLIQQAITWYSEKFPNGFYKTTDLNTQLDKIFIPLSQDGIDEINLSFAQIADIAAILTPDLTKNYTGTDKVLEILRYNPSNDNPILNKPIVDENQKQLPVDIIGYFIKHANSKKIKVDLSFGGAVATMQDYIIGDPIKAANDLIALMAKYNIENVDFDIENVQGLMNNGQDNVVTFFKTLHKGLENTNKKVYLTLLGSIGGGPKGALKPIFDNFDACADGVRLMMYSNVQFYIDANNPGWGIKPWLDILQDPSKISLGFYDKIAYENPQSSDPDYSATKYQSFPQNPTRAKAAIWIYEKVLSDLGLAVKQLDKPFIWVDDPTTVGQNQFVEEFNKYLNNGE